MEQTHELPARSDELWSCHRAPRLQGGAKVGPDGWFAEERVAATSSQGSTASG